MHIDPNGTVAGQPTLVIRRALRRLRDSEFDDGGIVDRRAFHLTDIDGPQPIEDRVARRRGTLHRRMFVCQGQRVSGVTPFDGD